MDDPSSGHRHYAVAGERTTAERCFRPGSPFFATGDNGSHLRLNFSNAQPEQIREGIRRLSIAVAHVLEHRPSAIMV